MRPSGADSARQAALETKNRMLGYEAIGAGPLHVIVLNDWLCDTSTWDGARAYFDRDRFSWAFADLRGYGRSRDQRGSYTLLEAAADVLQLADALGWQRFALVGHSMSTLITLRLAQQAPERITRAVVLTPAPPTGFGADDATLAVLQAVVRKRPCGPDTVAAGCGTLAS